MKFKLALIAMLAGASLFAQAQDATKVEPPKSTAKRADVKAETKAAAKAGEIKEGEAGAEASTKPKSTKKRADVKAETAAANKAGALKGGETAK